MKKILCIFLILFFCLNAEAQYNSYSTLSAAIASYLYAPGIPLPTPTRQAMAYDTNLIRLILYTPPMADSLMLQDSMQVVRDSFAAQTLGVVCAKGNNSNYSLIVNGGGTYSTSYAYNGINYSDGTHTGKIAYPSLTALRTWTFPNETGYILTSADTASEIATQYYVNTHSATYSPGTGLGLTGTTFYADSTQLPRWDDTLSTNRKLATYTWSNANFFPITDSSSLYGTSSNLIARDGNGNTHTNNFESAVYSVTATAGTTVMTVSSARGQILTGTTTQTYQLPDATTLHQGHVFEFNNNTTNSNLYVVNNSSSAVCTVPKGGYAVVTLTYNYTSAGTWDTHYMLPTASVGQVVYSVTATAPLTVSAAVNNINIGMPQANSSTNGWLSYTDWNTFNNKGSGSVTSFSSGNLSPLFTTSVATATTTPALSYSLSNAGANTLFGNNTSSSAAPVYFTPTLAGLPFGSEGTNHQVLHGNALSTFTWGAVSLTSDVSGTLPIANGGTNLTSQGSQGNVVKASNTGFYSAPDTSMLTFILNGSGTVINLNADTLLNAVPYNCTIVGWNLTAKELHGSCQWDLQVSGSSLIGSGNFPALSTAQTQDATPSSWTTTSLTTGQRIYGYLTSVTTCTYVQLKLLVTKL